MTFHNVTIEDDEMGPNIPPPGVVKVDADHEYANMTNTFVQYSGTLNATYELVRGYNATVAVNHFFALLDDRLRRLAGILAITGPVKDNGFFAKAFKNAFPVLGSILNLAKTIDGSEEELKKTAELLAKGGFVLPLSFRASEPTIYGKQLVRLSVSYCVLFNGQRFLMTGLWKPVPDSDWNKWVAPLNKFAWSARGNAGLKFTKDEDILISLCDPDIQQSGLGVAARQFQPTGGGQSTLTNDLPPVANSWMMYDNVVTLEENSSAIQQIPLATTAIPAPGIPIAGIGAFTSYRGFTPLQQDTPPAIIQQRSSSTYYLVMRGRAMRAGYQIPCPTIVSVAGNPAIPCNRRGQGFAQQVVANLGVPVYSAAWSLRFAISKAPQQLPPFPNPIYSTVGSTMVGTVTGGADGSGVAALSNTPFGNG